MEELGKSKVWWWGAQKQQGAGSSTCPRSEGPRQQCGCIPEPGPSGGSWTCSRPVGQELAGRKEGLLEGSWKRCPVELKGKGRNILASPFFLPSCFSASAPHFWKRPEFSKRVWEMYVPMKTDKGRERWGNEWIWEQNKQMNGTVQSLHCSALSSPSMPVEPPRHTFVLCLTEGNYPLYQHRCLRPSPQMGTYKAAHSP